MVFVVGSTGACPVCEEYRGYALEMLWIWREKVALLHIPLSKKGHKVRQRGSFTGIAIDTFCGVFSMLPAKLQSLSEAILVLLKLVARVRGKTLYLGGAALGLLFRSCLSRLGSN